ncbi:stage II sporulation protein M [Kangiella sp. HZ709]|uniref:stage II sporulation protein M n=1 Tax=Kangiella sp. HZ709 TaxID=2666328 RepID=UPI0012B09FF0|nr:stage II sporulation protein M [Kangiella sp. HZ709]MRX28141.1 stage II sporulation protein M [Kangiella sp. HZ709]
MRQQEFENLYQDNWTAFTEQCELLEKRKNLGADIDFSANYREVCHNLALAQQRGFSPGLVASLEKLSARGHQLLYKNRQSLFGRIVHFISKGFPRLVRKNAKLFWLTTAVCYIPALLVFLIIWADPDMAYSFLGSEQAASLESMYNPANDRITENRDIDSDFQMFGFYLWNNITVDLRTFAGGILAGIGSLLILLLNAVLLGAASGHMLNVGYDDTFFTFVIAHGAPELTGMVISAMAGLKIGWGLIAPGNYSRKDALFLRAKDGVRLLFGAIFLTAIAAPIEAFWSSIGTFDPSVKYTVGAFSWALVITYLVFAGRQGDTDGSQ